MEILLPPRGFCFQRTLDDSALTRLREKQNVTVKQVDVAAALTKTTLLMALSDALEAPDLYLTHCNFDSFDETVRDLNWLPFENLALVLVGSSRQWEKNYPAMSSILEICIDAHLFWKREGRGFFIVLVD